MYFTYLYEHNRKLVTEKRILFCNIKCNFFLRLSIAVGRFVFWNEGLWLAFDVRKGERIGRVSALGDQRQSGAHQHFLWSVSPGLPAWATRATQSSPVIPDNCLLEIREGDSNLSSLFHYHNSHFKLDELYLRRLHRGCQKRQIYMRKRVRGRERLRLGGKDWIAAHSFSLISCRRTLCTWISMNLCRRCYY